MQEQSLKFPRSAAFGLVLALGILALGFFSHSKLLSTITFGAVDFFYPTAKRLGVVAWLFGRNSEGTHHAFQLYGSLLFWWSCCTLAILLVGRAVRRAHA